MTGFFQRFFGIANGEIADPGLALAPVPGWPLALFPIAVLLACGLIVLRHAHRNALPAVKGRLLALRIAILVILLLLLLNPVLTGHRIEPGTQFLAVLYDNSQSMTLPGADGQSRGSKLDAWLLANRADFIKRLEEKWHVVQYSVGQGLRRLPDAASPGYTERESNLQPGIAQVARDLQGATLAGIVLFTDGVAQPGDAPAALPAPAVPVHTVSVEEAASEHDLAVANVAVAPTHFDENPFAVTVRGQALGAAGETVMVEVVEGNKILASRPLPVNGDAFQFQTRLEVHPDKKDWTVCTARVWLARAGQPAADASPEKLAVPGYDAVYQNNTRPLLLDNREKIFRILYFGGRPNWEHKFLQRALAADKQLAFSSVIRISGADRRFEFRAGKASLHNPLFEGFDPHEVQAPRYDEAVFVRLGLEADELKEGYPMEPEPLFPYHLIILGEVEHDFFTSTHLETTREAVTRRGASLLLLGGADAYTDGGYRGSLLEDMIPVMLPGNARAEAGREQAYSVTPTTDGFLSGVWSLNPDPDENARQWAELAPLFGLHQFPMTRIGATVWADARAGDTADERNTPFFAVQRYGAGKVAAIAAGETWPWKLESEADDTRHERFWRQVIRALVHDAPEQLARQVSGVQLTEWKPAPLRYQIRDAAYRSRSDLLAAATVTAPSGEIFELGLEEVLEQPGVYTSTLEPAEAGLYRMHLAARDEAGAPAGTLEDAVYVYPDTREFEEISPDPAFLRELSESTGGFHASLEDAASLPGRIPYMPGEHSTRVTFPLWHHALWLVLLAALLCTDWYLRRTRGMP
ncbi:MAG: hypothetical protein HYV27_16140 [Candidatus Hydrogenedentes bacterium]|nr:hypothetical protein [Candidatus Hydrogenedentota bacterium]